MPAGMEHELWVELFRERPEVVIELLRRTKKLKLPRYKELRIEEANFNQLVPTEYDSDLVVTLRSARGRRPLLSLIMEVQRGQDEDKLSTWPLYTAAFHAKRGVPAVVVVFATTSSVATWAQQTVEVGPGLVHTPIVFSPEDIPTELTDEDAARLPELAILCAMVHGNANDGGGLPGVIRALRVLDSIDERRARRYYDAILGALSDENGEALEEMMSSTEFESDSYRSDFARKYAALGRAEGKAEGAAEMLLAFLESKGLALSQEHREHIQSCRDLDVLKRWIQRAAHAEPEDDIALLLELEPSEDD